MFFASVLGIFTDTMCELPPIKIGSFWSRLLNFWFLYSLCFLLQFWVYSHFLCF